MRTQVPQQNIFERHAEYRWRVETHEGLTFRVEGWLELTQHGNTLIWQDSGDESHLVFGISPKLIQRITAEDSDA
jgi:hypothetical protein